MNQVFKVALPGYNAETDTNPDHYALYVNPKEAVDYVLIKVKDEGEVSVNGVDHNISHNLSYVPMCFVYAEISSGIWRKLFSRPIDSSGLWFEIDDTNLILNNNTGSPVNFSYRIFYDNIT